MDEKKITDNLVTDVTVANDEPMSPLVGAQRGESLDNCDPADSGAVMALREFAGRSQAALDQFVKVVDAVISSNLDLRSKVGEIGDGFTSVSQAFAGVSQRLLSIDQQTKAIGQLAGLTANIGNLAGNADLMIKQLLGSVNGIATDIVTLKQHNPQPVATPGNDMRLAALETAALLKVIPLTADFAEPVFRDGFDAWEALLAERYPHLFDIWHKLYLTALPHYEESIEASCSTWSNKFAVAFRDYVKIFAEGYVLDIGSGILNCPVYLEGYPARLLRGLDPRRVADKSDFPIATGVNEFLPWDDASFQTVVNGTSLDHVVDVDRSLDETARVLGKGGKFVIWYAHIENSPPPPDVDPKLAQPVIGVDEFHLFHIDDKWLLPKLSKRFDLIDRRIFPSGGFSHVFAAYECL